MKKTVIEPLVIEAIKELVKKKHFANAIENRISNFSNDDRLDKEIKNFEDKLNELNLTKARLETEIDTLPYDVKYREKKLNDLNLRLEKMYDAIAEVEEYIVNARFEKKALEKEKTTLENIRRILLNFSELFDIMNEQEQKNLLMYFVEEINLIPHWEKKSPLKSITLI